MAGRIPDARMGQSVAAWMNAVLGLIVASAPLWLVTPLLAEANMALVGLLVAGIAALTAWRNARARTVPAWMAWAILGLGLWLALSSWLIPQVGESATLSRWMGGLIALVAAYETWVARLAGRRPLEPRGAA